MGRLGLVCLALLTGGLAPVARLYPWKYFREKHAVREILRQYPHVTCRTLEVIPGRELDKGCCSCDRPRNECGPDALVLQGSVPCSQVKSLLSLRMALKHDAYLSEHCDITVELPGCVNWVRGSSTPPDPPFPFSVVFVARSK